MKSIASKLWAGMMALVVIVLVLLWLFQIVFLESFYTGMRVSAVKKEAASIARILEEGNLEEFAPKSDAFAFKNNLNLELVDRHGATVFTSGTTGMNGQMPMMRNKERAEAFQDALDGRVVTVSMLHPRFGNKFMLIAMPVSTAGEITGVLYINMPLAPVEDTTAILKTQLFYITLILLVAALVLSYLIARSFTKPILGIKRVAEKMASGVFTERIMTGSQDEIGKLADTINTMGQELSKLEQLRKDLIANVSHELRTPLSMIRGYAETLRDVSGDNPQKREKQLGIIIEESERLSRMVDDILNLSQLQAGYQKLSRGSFSLNRMIRDVMKRYEILSEKTGISLINREIGDIRIEADQSRMEQVLFNLVNNAFNHTPAGGCITIRAEETPDRIRVEVQDTGSGIPEADLPHVWNRYYRAAHENERKMVGTGLGLAIVKSVLEAHDASYGVRSGEGEGALFWFELSKSGNQLKKV
jgi:signal transduction histidine kinase